MSKKNKKNKQLTENKDIEVSSEIFSSEPMSVEVSTQKIFDTTEQLYQIGDAAARSIKDYKKHWSGPLKAHAKTMGMDPESSYSIETWKTVFKSWGAILK